MPADVGPMAHYAVHLQMAISVRRDTGRNCCVRLCPSPPLTHSRSHTGHMIPPRGPTPSTGRRPPAVPPGRCDIPLSPGAR
jgi:hypothetical protein